MMDENEEYARQGQFFHVDVSQRSERRDPEFSWRSGWMAGRLGGKWGWAAGMIKGNEK